MKERPAYNTYELTSNEELHLKLQKILKEDVNVNNTCIMHVLLLRCNPCFINLLSNTHEQVSL